MPRVRRALMGAAYREGGQNFYMLFKQYDKNNDGALDYEHEQCHIHTRHSPHARTNTHAHTCSKTKCAHDTHSLTREGAGVSVFP